jgi:hypothetical protein
MDQPIISVTIRSSVAAGFHRSCLSFGARRIIMRLILWIACLSLACGAAISEEPKGGVADKALLPSELGGQWTRRVQYLFDPIARPPEIFQVVTNISRRPGLSADEVDKFIARQKEERRGFAVTNLSRLGAEAEIILEYYDSKRSARFSMHIYRYKKSVGLEDMWKRRRTGVEFNPARAAGDDVIYTRVGQTFPGGVKASQPSVEGREGVYHVMVSPGQPELDDPGFRLVKKQLDKLRNGTEPDAAPNAAGPRP